MEASVTSFMHGFHVYQDIWTPFIGETLICRREDGNGHDRYIVAVVESAEVHSWPCAAHDFVHLLIISQARWNNEVHSGGKSALFKRPRTRRIGDSMQVHF